APQIQQAGAGGAERYGPLGFLAGGKMGDPVAGSGPAPLPAAAPPKIGGGNAFVNRWYDFLSSPGKWVNPNDPQVVQNTEDFMPPIRDTIRGGLGLGVSPDQAVQNQTAGTQPVNQGRPLDIQPGALLGRPPATVVGQPPAPIGQPRI